MSTDDANCQIDYISNSLKPDRVFFYTFNNETGSELEKYFRKELGTRLTGTCFYDEDIERLRNVATANTYGNADCITIYGFTPALGRLIKLLREGGYTGAIVASTGFNQPSVLDIVGDYAKSVSFADYDFPWQSKQHKIWNDEALATYKTSFSISSYQAYGAFRVFDELYSAGHHSPRDIGAQLSKDKVYGFKAGEEALAFTTHTDGGITSRLCMRIAGND